MYNVLYNFYYVQWGKALSYLPDKSADLSRNDSAWTNILNRSFQYLLENITENCLKNKQISYGLRFSEAIDSRCLDNSESLQNNLNNNIYKHISHNSLPPDKFIPLLVTK